jgi:hypothetical protein
MTVEEAALAERVAVVSGALPLGRNQVLIAHISERRRQISTPGGYFPPLQISQSISSLSKGAV